MLTNTILFNPTHISESRLRDRIEESIGAIAWDRGRQEDEQRWLDVGCGMRPYEELFPPGVYVGLDVANRGRDSAMKRADHYYEGGVLPFSDNSFSGVFCTQVLEHVPHPGELLDEIARVLIPGGRGVISLPFVWEEHEVPYDFFRFTRFGIVELLSRSGLEVEHLQADTGTAETLAMLVNTYISNDLVPRIYFRGVSRAVALLVCFPIQLLALTLKKVLPDHGRIYLNLVIRVRKPI